MNTASRTTFKIGDRIRLVAMHDDPDPITAGTTGIIDHVAVLPDGETQYGVAWENGRTLFVVCPPDVIELARAKPPV